MKTNKSRISSGIYKGRFIDLPQTDETRPTKSIVKESAINTLKPDIPYSVFVEVFAGSGSVGIEALSNRSKKAYFLEISKETAKILKNNLTSLEIKEYEIRIGNSFELIGALAKELENQNMKTIFYFDPPFNIRENQEEIYAKTSEAVSKLPASIVQTIAIEHLSSHEFEDFIGEYKKYKKKRFGKTTLTYYKGTVE